MGVLVDIVPNHVGVASPRPATWWWDVLEHGPASRVRVVLRHRLGGRRRAAPAARPGRRRRGGRSRCSRRQREVYHDLRLPMAPGTTSLGEQHYELVSWRRGDAELNYRRFFTVTTLAGVRVEEPGGVRGLAPGDRALVRRRPGRRPARRPPRRAARPGGLPRPARDAHRRGYVVVEKILEPGESLPATWATAGTTGYDVLALVDRVLTDPAGRGGCSPPWRPGRLPER